MYGFKPQHARVKPVQQAPQAQQSGANGSVTPFGSKGLNELRNLIPQMEAMGYPQAQPQDNRGAAGLKAIIPQMEAMGYKQQPQYFADGGFVQGIKRAFGMDEERNAQIAAYRARAAAEKAQQQAQAQQQTPQPQQSAVTQYSGMSATQRREKELGLADGGRVRPRGFVAGKGTGTSDSIPARLSNGEYVLPADTVRAVGVDALDALRESTHQPVKGEQANAARGFFAGGTPGGVGTWFQDQEREQEQRKQAANSIASEAMAQSQAESDKLAAQSSRPAAPIGGLANNGGADASRFAQVPAPIGTQPGRTPEPAAQPAAPVPTAASTQSAGQPLDAQAASDRAKLGAAWDTVKDVNDSAGRAIADVAMLAPRAVAGAYDSAVVRPMRAAGFNAGYLSPILVPNGVDPSSMTPYADQKRMQEQAGAVAPSAPAATSSVAATASTAGAGRGVVNPPLAKPSAPAPSAPQPEAKTGNEIMPGVFKHGRGQYSDQSTGMGMPAGFTGQPNAQNMAAADALVARKTTAGFQPAGLPQASVQAPIVRNSTNDWAARKALENAATAASSITANGGRFDRNGRAGSSQAAAYRAALANDFALQQAQPGMDQAAMRENAGIQRESMQQEGATTRTGMTEQGSNAREAGRNALAQGEFGLKREAAGFQTRAAAQQEQLRNVLLDPNASPEQRKIAQRSLAALSGKTAADRMQTVALPDTTNEMGQVVRGGQALVRVLEDGSVQQVPIGAAPAPQAMPKPASKAEFDALPKGARFTDPNGQVRIK